MENSFVNQEAQSDAILLLAGKVVRQLGELVTHNAPSEYPEIEILPNVENHARRFEKSERRFRTVLTIERNDGTKILSIHAYDG